MQTLKRVMLLGLALSGPLPATAGVVNSVDIGIGTDDNISAAPDTRVRRADQLLQLGLGSTLNTAVGPGLGLRLAGRLDGRLHRRYEGLNHAAASLEGALLLRPGRDFHTPTLGAALGIGFQQFNSRLRDGQHAQVRLFVREALTTRLAARASVFALWRGTSGLAFDSSPKGGDLALDWQATQALAVTLAYRYQYGEVSSTALRGVARTEQFSSGYSLAETPSPGVARVLDRVLTVEPDDAFPGLLAVSFPAQTHIGNVALSYALTPRVSLDAQLRYVESDSNFDSQYHHWTTLSGLTARF